jgi:hypothetical protein
VLAAHPGGSQGRPGTTSGSQPISQYGLPYLLLPEAPKPGRRAYAGTRCFRGAVSCPDNGSEFQSSFHWHLLDRGIRHAYIKPATPRLNGKVERSHRTDAEEFYRMLEGVVIDDSELFNDRLRQWEDFYNFDRPHGGLGGQTPYERLRQKTTTPA